MRYRIVLLAVLASIALGLWAVASASAESHPDTATADLFAKAICVALPVAVQRPGDTFTSWHCKPDRWDPYIGDWEYSVWTDEHLGARVRHWYIVALADGSILAQTRCARSFPATCGLRA